MGDKGPICFSTAVRSAHAYVNRQDRSLAWLHSLLEPRRFGVLAMRVAALAESIHTLVYASTYSLLRSSGSNGLCGRGLWVLASCCTHAALAATQTLGNQAAMRVEEPSVCKSGLVPYGYSTRAGLSETPSVLMLKPYLQTFYLTSWLRSWFQQFGSTARREKS